MKRILTGVLPLMGILFMFLSYSVSADSLISSYSLSNFEGVEFGAKSYAVNGNSCTNSNPRECTSQRIQECLNNDGYCPTNCTYDTDIDCIVEIQPEAAAENRELRGASNDTIIDDITKKAVQKDKTFLQMVLEWFARWFE